MTATKELPVYKTMVAPHSDSIGNLTGWRRPTHAYVLLEQPQWNIISDGVRVKGMGLVTLNAESRAEIQHQVDIYLNKGGRILDYGNFPSLNTGNAKRREKAMHYSQGTGINAWDALENHVKRRMAADVNWREEKAEMAGEMDALKAKLAEQEAKLKAAEEQAAKKAAEKPSKSVAEKATDVEKAEKPTVEKPLGGLHTQK